MSSMSQETLPLSKCDDGWPTLRRILKQDGASAREFVAQPDAENSEPSLSIPAQHAAEQGTATHKKSENDQQPKDSVRPPFPQGFRLFPEHLSPSISAASQRYGCRRKDILRGGTAPALLTASDDAGGSWQSSSAENGDARSSSNRPAEGTAERANPGRSGKCAWAHRPRPSCGFYRGSKTSNEPGRSRRSEW